MQGTWMWMPRVRAMASAGVLALGMVAVLSVPTFAKGLPLNERGLPSAVARQTLMASAQAAPVDAMTGVVIIAIDAEGPAAQAGIGRGDILVKAGDAEINSAVALFEVVTAAKPGDTIELFVYHGDEPRTIAVVLGAVTNAQGGERAYLGVQVADAPVESMGAGVAMPALESPPVVDVQIITDTASSAVATAVPAPPLGLIVAEVVADGPAALAGLAAGDVIAAMDGVPVFSADDFINALKGHTPGEVVVLTVQKGGVAEAMVAEIPVTLGAAPDDPARAYLGIRLLSPSSGVTIEMAPPTGPFTAPAMPAMPPLPMIPAYPEMAPGYAYPYPYAVPGVEAGNACGTTIINNYYYYGVGAPAVPAAGATFSVPISPRPFAVPALPVMPADPVYIYQEGINPEVYADPVMGPVMGTTEKNVIFYRAEPAQPGVNEQHFEIQVLPGMAPVLPPMVPGQKEGDVVFIRKDVNGANVTVTTGVAGSGVAVGEMISEPVPQKNVVIVKGQATPDVVWATPVDPAAGMALPQVAPLPATDGWY